MDIHKKDLLFYSTFCEHCNNLISTLVKKNVRDSFILVCVDKRELKIPQFIDRVPTILTSKKEIYTDDSLYDYVESKIVKYNPQTEEILPFMLGTSLNSSQYTFITPDGNDYESERETGSEMLQSRNFVPIGLEQMISPMASKDQENGKPSKIDPNMLEQFMNSRKLDDENIKRHLNTNRLY
jgi:hypothetical protein